jgi:hypothetical protein
MKNLSLCKDEKKKIVTKHEQNMQSIDEFFKRLDEGLLIDRYFSKRDMKSYEKWKKKQIIS